MIDTPQEAAAFFKEHGYTQGKVIQTACPCCHAQVTAVWKKPKHRKPFLVVVWNDQKPFEESDGIVWAANELAKENS